MGKVMMLLTNRALFVIERNLNSDLSLERIAGYCEVSRFHLAHAFGESIGRSVMDYVRGRRLTEAAYALAAGAGNILNLALDSRYSSHEAFSRAFKAQFGRTPDEVRETETVNGLKLVNAIRHLESKAMILKEPRIERVGELLFAGLNEHVAYAETQSIAGQWQQFMSSFYGDMIINSPSRRSASPPDRMKSASIMFVLPACRRSAGYRKPASRSRSRQRSTPYSLMIVMSRNCVGPTMPSGTTGFPKAAEHLRRRRALKDITARSIPAPATAV
jgi:AraC-like DNA-binding protein